MLVGGGEVVVVAAVVDVDEGFRSAAAAAAVDVQHGEVRAGGGWKKRWQVFKAKILQNSASHPSS